MQSSIKVPCVSWALKVLALLITSCATVVGACATKEIKSFCYLTEEYEKHKLQFGYKSVLLFKSGRSVNNLLKFSEAYSYVDIVKLRRCFRKEHLLLEASL